MSLRDQLYRQWRLLRLLEGGSALGTRELLRALAGEGGRAWSRRTLGRDLVLLEAAGFPVERLREGGRTLWRLIPAVREGVPPPFTLSELAGLFWALSEWRGAPESPLEGEPLGGCLSELYRKLGELLPPSFRRYAEVLDGRYGGAVRVLGERGRRRRLAGILAEAIAERRPVRLLAARKGESRKKWRKLDPYLLKYRRGDYHILGWDAREGEVQVLTLGRVEAIRKDVGGFQLPLGLDLEAALEERLRGAPKEAIEVRFRVSRSVASQLEEGWLAQLFGPAQRLRSGRRGEEWTLRPSDPEAFLRWLMSLGP
ncbi:MAG: helix-turn-helix transcriptional regulator, partial [Nitrospinota bacterium]